MGHSIRLRQNRWPTLTTLAAVSFFIVVTPQAATATSIYKIEFSGYFSGRTTPALERGDRVTGEFFFADNPLPLVIANPNNTVYRQNDRLFDVSLLINDVHQAIGSSLDPFNLFSEINDHIAESPFRFDSVEFGVTLSSGIRMNVIFQAPNRTFVSNGRYPRSLGLAPWRPHVRVVDFINGPPLGDLTLTSTSVRAVPESSATLLSIIGILALAMRPAALRRRKRERI